MGPCGDRFVISDRIVSGDRFATGDRNVSAWFTTFVAGLFFALLCSSVPFCALLCSSVLFWATLGVACSVCLSVRPHVSLSLRPAALIYKFF